MGIFLTIFFFSFYLWHFNLSLSVESFNLNCDNLVILLSSNKSRFFSVNRFFFEIMKNGFLSTYWTLHFIYWSVHLMMSYLIIYKLLFIIWDSCKLFGQFQNSSLRYWEKIVLKCKYLCHSFEKTVSKSMDLLMQIYCSTISKHSKCLLIPSSSRLIDKYLLEVILFVDGCFCVVENIYSIGW